MNFPAQLLRWLAGSMLAVALLGWPASPASSATPARAEAETASNRFPLERGIELYRQGQFAAAAEVWEQAARLYQQQGDRLYFVKALAFLSGAYRELDRYDRAQAVLDTSQASLNRNARPTRAWAIASGQVSSFRGELELATGRLDRALVAWQASERFYARANYDEGIKGSQINQARVLDQIGLDRRACHILMRALDFTPTGDDCAFASVDELQVFLELFKSQANGATDIAALQTLAKLWRDMGEPDLSIDLFVQAGRHSDPLSAAGLHVALELGKSWKARGDFQRDRQTPTRYSAQLWDCQLPQPIQLSDPAIANAYERSLALFERAAQSGTGETRLRAQLELVGLLTERGQLAAAARLADRIDLSAIAASSTRVSARIDYARKLYCWQDRATPHRETPSDYSERIARQLALAVRDAEALGDARALSYAYGHLAGRYLQENRLDEALELSERALLVLAGSNAPEIGYQWHWQLGQIARRRGNAEQALYHYEAAARLLQFVRLNFASAQLNARLSFRDRVEPLYRELIELLLSDRQGRSPSQLDLEKAIYYTEALQLADLENFLDCRLDPRTLPEAIKATADPKRDRARLVQHLRKTFSDGETAALVYAIVLETRIAVLLKLPGQDRLLYHTTNVPASVVNEKLKYLRYQVIPKANFYGPRDNPPIEEVYRWLLPPFESVLASHDIDTLIFIQDGLFQNVPVASLYDGEQYLVEKYAVGVAPSVQLLVAPGGDRLSKLSRRRTLVAGISTAQPDLRLPELPAVRDEIDFVTQVFSNATLLAEREFTTEALESALAQDDYEILHLATHAQFSSDPGEAFIVTADRFLSIEAFADLLSNTPTPSAPLDLLFLSGCQTASGDRRAILGLAGVASRGRADSTIASVWKVGDRASEVFVQAFYGHLLGSEADSTSKIRALQAAQLALMADPNFEAPRHWAAFTLVGDWR